MRRGQTIFPHTWDKGRWPNFSPDEFKCSHTGRLAMDEHFLDLVQEVRSLYGKPLVITSGYRDPKHPIEARKSSPGSHAMGLAADIAPEDSAYAQYKLLFAVCDAVNQKLYQAGIGMKGKPGRFIHLDIAPSRPDAPRPALWFY